MEEFVFDKKAVLWDLDDTLYSRRSAAGRMFPGMLEQCLYTNQSEAFLEEAAAFLLSQIRGNSMLEENAFRALLQRYPADKPYSAEACKAYYYAHIRSFAQPVPEAVEVVKKLKAQGVKMAIVTNIVPELLEHQHKKVEALGIAELFDAVIYSAELGIHKPDRRIFDYAASCLGVSNAQCLFVGDDPDTDVTGALNADMEVVWLDHRNLGDPFDQNPRVHRVGSVSEYFRL